MKINLMVVISLVVAMSAAMVAPVGAAPTGTSVITGNPGYIIDIVVTGDITGWALVAGTTNTNSTGVDLVVSSNEIGWTVAVRDALDGSKDAATAGKMTNYTGSSYASGSLAANLTVAGESVSGKSTGAGVTLSGIPQTIETGLDVVTSDSMHITIGQAVAYTDPRLPNPNVYRIIVTFTGVVP